MLASAPDVRGCQVTRPIYQVKAEFFKVLGHPARIRVLELLRGGERSVGQLLPEVGLEPSHLSQQLGVLRRANLVQARKEGSTVHYSVSDKRIFELLEVAKTILTSTLLETRELLVELEGMEFTDRPARRRSAS
jgi:DNA-binding transcriptional ArsR family regulator